ncbi:MAG: ABC transporter ATP-binding protein [Desulfocapsaceae bacterium]|nr:ABC transporter ATP-binding protein [Desulfocapsaceae bacterium]
MNPRDPGQDPAIQTAGLIKKYRLADRPALTGLDLTIGRGEFFGLLGPNGAGKTTILSILCGLRAPDGGTVRILGMEYRRQQRRIQERIGIVPQEIALYDQLTARENLIIFGRLLGLGGGRLKERTGYCLEIAQLHERADHRVASFSGGMKRRLNLVIGLLNAPSILFLDEPTVGIDTQSRHLIHRQLQGLHAQGTTLLYTTHYMEEAQELCSTIAILDEGRILRQGPPARLLQESACHSLEELFLGLTGKQIRDI